MNLKANLRIEDLLSGALAVLLLSYAGVRSLLAGLAIDEEHYEITGTDASYAR